MKYRRYQNRFIKELDNTLKIDAAFNLNQLLTKKFNFFQFHDQYGYEGNNFSTKGLIRKKIIQLLFEIHDEWKIELDKLNKPYYLAIWLCEPRLLLSEVVCGIDERMDKYENHFFTNSNKSNPIKTDKYGKLNIRFEEFSWERKVAFEVYTNTDYGWPKEHYQNESDYYKNRKFFKRVLPKCNKIKENKYGKIYYREMGDYLVGRKLSDTK